MDCYCKNEMSFAECCLPIIDGSRLAESSEELMRSRYSAFCTKNYDHLISSHDPQTRKFLDITEMKNWAEKATFHNLQILKAEDLGNKGAVEFKAYYHMDGEEHIHHELARFRKQAGEWYFRDSKNGIS